MTMPQDTPPSDALATLEANLAAQILGLRILDRQLELESKRGAAGRVDFAGTDGEGRLVLIALVEDASDAASLAALDLAVLARRHGALIARHLGLDPATAVEPRLILVAEKYDELLLARLSAFGELFELFAIETLRSDRGAQTYLVPPASAGRSAAASPEAITRESFLAGLQERHRVPAELLLARLERMDSEIAITFTEAGVRWSFHGNDFLGAAVSGEQLVGFLLPGGEDVVLDSVDAVEGLVEQAFGGYVRLLGLFDESDAPQATPPEPTGTLLTEEEIAAFQAQ